MTRKPIKISQQVSVMPPMVPNYLNIGDDKNTCYKPLSCFSEKALRKIGKVWTENLIKRAQQQTKDMK